MEGERDETRSGRKKIPETTTRGTGLNLEERQKDDGKHQGNDHRHQDEKSALVSRKPQTNPLLYFPTIEPCHSS